ncbi:MULTISPECIES: DUF986 family protein [unclassified Lonepinella]|uniref:DUF986 family protein n=1 Tax=unclassified Lonepinella TaxID=2642006 RepID=UPI0036DC0A77
MTNTILILCILAFFTYAFYEQFGLDKRQGKTLLKVRLKKRTKLDSLIFVALIGIIIWQTEGKIAPDTLYLLTFLILLSLYIAFFRSPMLILKPNGFFFENFFIEFAKIQQINLADDFKLVFDLTNGKRLVAQLTEQSDVEKVVQFFGGYKQEQQDKK